MTWGDDRLFIECNRCTKNQQQHLWQSSSKSDQECSTFVTSSKHWFTCVVPSNEWREVTCPRHAATIFLITLIFFLSLWLMSEDGRSPSNLHLLVTVFVDKCCFASRTHLAGFSCGPHAPENVSWNEAFWHDMTVVKTGTNSEQSCNFWIRRWNGCCWRQPFRHS